MFDLGSHWKEKRIADWWCPFSSQTATQSPVIKGITRTSLISISSDINPKTAFKQFLEFRKYQ